MIGKQKIFAMALVAAAAAPVSATALPAGSGTGTFSAFDIKTQGTQLVASTQTAATGTFTGLLSTAVYQNTLGTLDFYYQFARNAGTDAVERITGGSFSGFTVDALFTDADVDGDKTVFSAGNNPGADATATFSSASDGGVVGVNLFSNPISGTETSATYIFRTNATSFVKGKVGVIDSQTYSGDGYMPAVPEVSTWAMMVLGFGAAGAAVRRSRRTRVLFA